MSTLFLSMQIDELKSQFMNSSRIKCIKSDYNAIHDALKNTKKEDSIGIIGTHYLGDAISKIFNISFNLL